MRRLSWLVFAAVALSAVGTSWAGGLDFDGTPPAGLPGDATPRGDSYMGYTHFGGTWYDAEKSPLTGQDDLLCWAAAAANVLKWTGWGHVGGMTSADAMFDYFVDHWTNAGSYMVYGWDWWFDGTNPSQGWSGYSQVDSPGGGFFPGENLYSHYHSSTNDATAMATIDSYLRTGYGVTLGIYGPGSHAITCWGVNYNPSNPSEYYGLWITDSDDSKTDPTPPDRLRYYDVAASGGKWYLQDYFGTDTWYIGEVQALELNPALAPEPTTLALLAIGGVALPFRAARRSTRRRTKQHEEPRRTMQVIV